MITLKKPTNQKKLKEHYKYDHVYKNKTKESLRNWKL